MDNLLARVREPEWILSVCVMGFLMSLAASYAQRGIDGLRAAVSRRAANRQTEHQQKILRAAKDLMEQDLEARMNTRMLAMVNSVLAHVQVALALLAYVLSLQSTSHIGLSPIAIVMGLVGVMASLAAVVTLRRARVLNETVDQLNRLLKEKAFAEFMERMGGPA